jgi:hypothetical protein
VSSSPALTALEAVETPALRSRRLLRRAERAITEQRFDDASGDLETVATSGSLDAEVANFKKADLELRRLGNPTRALATLEAGEARFPTGALSQERQLTALESCAKLERWAEVERRDWREQSAALLTEAGLAAAAASLRQWSAATGGSAPLRDAETGVLKDGTGIGDGLALAVNRLRNSSARSRVIILLWSMTTELSSS